jgi:hypothetical protein
MGAPRRGPGHAGFAQLIRNYKKGAKERGLSWDLTEEQARQFFLSPCYFCDEPPSNISRRSEKDGFTAAGVKHGEFVYSGIDRINNNDGYVLSNCVPCCKRCNLLKRDAGITDIPRLHAIVRLLIEAHVAADAWNAMLDQEREKNLKRKKSK